MTEAFRGIFPMEQLEQMGRQNMVLFENAMKMLSPFGGQTPPKAGAPEEKAKGENIDDLKAQLNEMQAQLAKLVKDRE
jgi:polyhydroxyalkanoate synthesis regulator protein